MDLEEKQITQQRKPWNSKVEFLLSSVGYAVGLGNIWRFPYKAYTNGGGSFLIPYIIMVIILGFPTFFLESALGQWSAQGPTKIYGRLAPAFKGLGFGMVATAFVIAIYYNVVVGWALFYLYNGFKSVLPWSKCVNGSVHCYEGLINTTIKENDPFAVGPSEDYFNNALLGFDKNLHNWSDLGEIHWPMILCLIGAWIIVCTSAIRGVQSIGKVAYFSAIFPYIMLSVLLIYGMVVDFEGSLIGIRGYVTPKWEKVLDISVWKEAAIQIVFSLSIGVGILGTSSSYNKFNNNCFHDTIAVVIINCATSVFAGFVVFSYLGIMAHDQGQTDVENTVEGGIGLVFKVFPELITKLGAWPMPQILTVFLFVMVIALGLGTICGLMETITSAIMDHLQSSSLRGYWFSKKAVIVIATSILCFILGISMCLQGGYFIFDLLDSNALGWNTLLLIIIELILVTWIYGAENFFENVKQMGIDQSKAVKMYLKVTWCIVTPLVLLGLVISSLNSQSTKVTHMYTRPAGDMEWITPSLSNPVSETSQELRETQALAYGPKAIKTPIDGNFHINGSVYHIKADDETVSISYVWPDGIQALGWIISLTPILLVLIIALYQFCKRYYEGKKEWRGLKMFQPTEHWRPNNGQKADVEEVLLKEITIKHIIQRQDSTVGS